MGCLTIAQSYIDIRLVLLEMGRVGQIDRPPPPPPQKKLPSKSPALLGLKITCFKD